eukprot:6181794-Pleurochrysis_carterae.AAC.2
MVLAAGRAGPYGCIRSCALFAWSLVVLIPTVYGRGAGAGAEAGARLGGGSRREHSAGKGGNRERVFKSMGSGAQALGKYAGDATAI